jgi:hypothetical protein
VEPFSVGEHVVIRHGERQGQRGRVVERQPAEVYKVLLGDGTALFFCRQSLLREAAGRPTRLSASAWGVPSKN